MAFLPSKASGLSNFFSDKTSTAIDWKAPALPEQINLSFGRPAPPVGRSDNSGGHRPNGGPAAALTATLRPGDDSG